jgi:sn-glycerol 3-phosphate transport system substrate-binding protein
MKRLGLLLLAILVAACGGDSTAAPTETQTPPAGKVVEVTFWHGFAAGANQDATNALAQKFNDSHTSKIKVTPVFAGNYDDTFAKIKTSITAGNTPQLVQIYDLGTRFMIDSKKVTPVQNFIDQDKYNTDLEPIVANYFTINKKLYSMPWNNSMPILYYNKDAFTAAGLDPNKPPQTLDEIRTMAQKLTKKDANGQTTQYGFGAAVYGWLLEQFAARADVELCNNGNGRDKNATRLLADSPQLIKVMDWWKQMVADGLALGLFSTQRDLDSRRPRGRRSFAVDHERPPRLRAARGLGVREVPGDLGEHGLLAHQDGLLPGHHQVAD